MKNRYQGIVSNALLAIDLLLLNNCFTISHLVFYGFQREALSPEFIGLALYVNLLWIIIAKALKIYQHIRHKKLQQMLISNFMAIVLFFFFYLLYFQFVSFNYLERDAIKYYFLLFAAIVMIVHSGMRFFLPFFFRRLNHRKNAIIVGYNDFAGELQSFLENDSWSDYSFLGYFTDRKPSSVPILGDYNDLKPYLETHRVDEMFLLLNVIPEKTKIDLIETINNQSTNIHLVPDLSMFMMMNVSVLNFGNVPVLELQRSPLNKIPNRWIKRFFDIFMSVFVIIGILSWLTPLLWLINRVFYRQGVFFVQERNGLNNKVFRCYKFKSMHDNAHADLQAATREDQRTTPLGRFLRASSIDELPQFINILAGQMSLVGPRPHMLKHTSEYRKVLNQFMVRHIVKPGLTGLAQVNGFRGGIFNQNQLKNRVSMDIRYIENWTLWMDIKIIFLTLINLLIGEKNAF
jgi:putative colanic acid biosysnthesis UDP-glucose lipid carrier transferase